jgi:ATP-dependent protease ClpP protease subunit
MFDGLTLTKPKPIVLTPNNGPLTGIVSLEAVTADGNDNASMDQQTPVPVVVQPQPPPPKLYGMSIINLPLVKSFPFIIEYQGDIPSYDVYITTDIGNSADGFYEDNIINILDNAMDGCNVKVYICSYGGDLFSGTRIAAAMLRTKAHVTTIAIGYCCSAAALIWSYGHERVVEPGGYLMFHMASHSDYGNSVGIQQEAGDIVAYVKEVCVKRAIEIGLMSEQDAMDLIERKQDIYYDAWDVHPNSSADDEEVVS